MADAQDKTALPSIDRSNSVTVDEGAAALLELMPGDDDVFPETDEKDTKPAKDTKSETDDTSDDIDETDDLVDYLDDDEKEEVDDTSDDDDEDDEDDKDETPTLYKVKADGKELEVPLEELIKGYSRTANYTQDKQKLSDERKAFVAKEAEVTSQREQYAARLDQLAEALGDPKEPDWDALKAKDPEAYAIAVADWQRDKDRRKTLADEQARVAQEHATEIATKREEAVLQEFGKLVELLPEYADPEKRTAITKEWVEYGPSIGLTEAEIDSVVDHRVLVALNKSMLYDRIVARRDALKDKKKTAKTIRPGTKKTPKDKQKKNRSELISRARQHGTVDAAANALMSFDDDE